MATVEHASATIGPRRGPLRALAVSLRPVEWIKNLVVFAAVLFSGRFEIGVFDDAVLTFVAFCAVSSAGYLVNDLRDAELDRRHPTKRSRPIASGELPRGLAMAVAPVLVLLALAVALIVRTEVAAVVAAYAVATFGYTLLLKRLVIIDVMTIGACFLLRVYAGALAIDVTASRWLLVCTGMVSLFLGFAKRRQEAALELQAKTGTRPVLEHYSLPFLDQMVSMVTAGTVIAYTLYAADSPQVGDKMLASTPMVIYAIFRYLYLIYDRNEQRDAARLLTSDPGMLVASIAWAVTVAVLIYA